jgi:hypothetical protein
MKSEDKYCPRQFTWRVQSIEAIWFGSLQFDLCNGTEKLVVGDRITFCVTKYAVPFTARQARCVQERNVTLCGSTEQRMLRTLRTSSRPSIL